MYFKEVTETEIRTTDTETGVVKTVKLASESQMKYIRDMLTKLGKPQPQYKHLPMYRATKIIKKLQDKTKQLTLI